MSAERQEISFNSRVEINPSSDATSFDQKAPSPIVWTRSWKRPTALAPAVSPPDINAKSGTYKPNGEYITLCHRGHSRQAHK